MESFRQKVYNVVSKIPRGSVMTYRQVAIAIGKPRAYRAVGNALNKNPNPYPLKLCKEKLLSLQIIKRHVPCHRVVRSDGSVGGFASGSKAKIDRLKAEGYLR